MTRLVHEIGGIDLPGLFEVFACFLTFGFLDFLLMSFPPSSRKQLKFGWLRDGIQRQHQPVGNCADNGDGHGIAELAICLRVRDRNMERVRKALQAGTFARRQPAQVSSVYLWTASVFPVDLQIKLDRYSVV